MMIACAWRLARTPRLEPLSGQAWGMQRIAIRPQARRAQMVSLCCGFCCRSAHCAVRHLHPMSALAISDRNAVAASQPTQEEEPCADAVLTSLDKTRPVARLRGSGAGAACGHGRGRRERWPRSAAALQWGWPPTRSVVAHADHLLLTSAFGAMLWWARGVRAPIVWFGCSYAATWAVSRGCRARIAYSAGGPPPWLLAWVLPLRCRLRSLPLPRGVS